MHKLTRNLLFTPGPATTTDTVKQAQVVPDICPREPAFADLVREVQQRILQVAGVRAESHVCVLFGGSGTAAVDAALNSSVSEGGTAAVIINGAYGQRMADILHAYGIPVAPIKQPATRPLDPGPLRDLLSRSALSMVAMVHHETSTGLVNPVRAVGQLARQANCIFVVDAISSLGGMPLHMEEEGIDLLVGTSNKALQGLPGLSWVIVRRAVLPILRNHPQRSYYLNLIQQHDCLERTGQFRFTAPVTAVYALRQALIELEEEGLAQRMARYGELAKRLREGLRRLGYRLLLEDAWSAPVMTSVLEPDDPAWNFQRVHDTLLARGITIYPGKVPDQRTFRIATLGDLHAEDVDCLLAALREAYPCPPRP